MKNANNGSLQELLESATTIEDFQKLEQLIATHEPPHRWAVSTLAEVAEFFGYAFQTVKQWRCQVPPMPGTPGHWQLSDIAQWKLKKTSNEEISIAKRQQDLQLGQVQLEAKMLALEKERCQLLDRGDIERWAATALIEARVMIMSLPERLATSAPPEMRSFIREESDRHCRDVLTSLRRRLEMDETNQTDSDQISTATGEDPVE